MAEPKKKENPYEKCFCFSHGRCGPFKKWNKDGLTLTSVNIVFQSFFTISK